MAVEIQHLSTDTIARNIERDDRNFLSEEFMFIGNSDKVRMFAELNRPFRIDEARMMRVASGSARYQINMVDYTLDPFMVVVVPENSIILVKGYSDDFAVQAMTIKDLEEEYRIDRVRTARLENADWQRMSEYIDLIWRVVHTRDYSITIVHHLQMAMLGDFKRLETSQISSHEKDKPTRVQHTFSEFVRLVNEHGAREHRVHFYADKLFITPNRLSSLVKQQSGETAMQWINRAIILEAKVLLRHSDLKNYEIANRLNFPSASLFSNFFKKQTGQTPLEYKER